MALVSMGGEGRAPSSYHGIGSPRYGGCVGAFLHFFDWNPGKRFYSTKRLNASKPEGGLLRSRSLRSDHGSAARTRMIFDSPPGKNSAGGDDGSSVPHGDSGRVFSGDDISFTSSRAPSVVARLMGLDSLPKSPYHLGRHHRRSLSYSGAGELPYSYMASRVEDDEEEEELGPPVVLQELLQRDFKASKKSLRDRMPGFGKRAQEHYETRLSKTGAALKVLRCRQDECLSPYRDVPDVAQLQAKQPFLSRLATAPGTTAMPRDASPSKVSTPEIAAELAGDWPVVGQVSRESSFRGERSSLLESECSSRRPASTKASKPAMAIAAMKMFQGRRRDPGSGWNGSEDSEPTSSQVDFEFRPPPQHRKTRVAAREPPMKKVTKSLSPPARHDRTIRTKAGTHSIRDLKSPRGRISAMPKAVQSIRRSSITEDSMLRDQRQPLIQSRSRSTDFQFPVLESATSRTVSPASGLQEATSTASEASIVPPIASVTASRSKRAGGVTFTNNSKSAAVPTPAPLNKAPPLDGSRASKVTKHIQKTGVQKRIAAPARSLPAENANASKGWTTFASSKPSTKSTLQGIQRARKTMHPTPASPLSDRPNSDEPTTPSYVNSKIADDTHFRSRANSTALKHRRARSTGDVTTSKPAPISTEVDMKLSKHVVLAPTSNGVCEPVFQIDLQEFFAAGADELRWEEDDKDQRVGAELRDELSGRFCERSCSGPSISSASVDVSDGDDERNGDAWSSCASYNAADCDSPRAFELPDTDADADACDLHDRNNSSTPPTMYVPKLPDPVESQPSPVSILNSPFHDEPCTPTASDEDTPVPQPEEPTQELHQALLDHSLFQSFTFSYKEVTSPKESMQGFVHELLSPQLPPAPPPPPIVVVSSTPAGSSSTLPNSPDFHDLNIRSIPKPVVGGKNLWEDAVKEFLGAGSARWWQHHERCQEVAPWKACFCQNVRPLGVEDVYAKVEEWRKLAAVSMDMVVEREMMRDWEECRRGGVAMVEGEIEKWVWKRVVQEVVEDLVACGKPKSPVEIIHKAVS